MLRILNAIVGRAHWVYSVSEVVFEFVKIQFTETHPKLGKPCWIIYSKDITDFGKGRIFDNSLVLNAAIEGACLISVSSLFHSDRQ